MKKHAVISKEKLSPRDRINAFPPSIRLKLDPTKDVTPRAHSRPFDVPYNLREPMNKELSDGIEAGVAYFPQVVTQVTGYTKCSQCQNQGSQK